MATTGCSTLTPPTDNRCDDPAFREANPDLCKYHPVLILQPSYAITEPGATVEYKVILRANGVETELTLGLTWDISNLGAATIDPTGVATGVAAGQTSISVEWQDLSASAQLDVVGSCEDTTQNFRLLIDRSKSMGQSFNSLYSTKFDFAKATARDFLPTVNLAKDSIAISYFGSGYTEVQPWVNNSVLPTMPLLLLGSSEKTNIASALENAIEGFEGQTGTRVIVLFTDGEWTGENPVPIAKAFKETGGFICVVAIRSWGSYFVDMLAVASDGFLLSAYDDTADSILENLSGLKSFLCSGGSCVPAQNSAPYAQLNYTGFINWDVTRGRVDLVGLGLWDVQPGNGLYVDLQGTANGPNDPFDNGQITSKESFDFEDGKSYSLEISIGGSIIGPKPGNWPVRIRAGDGLDETETVTIGNTPLTPTLFEWTQSGDYSGPIIIEMDTAQNLRNVGALIDEITLRNETDDEVMLYDNFDSENPTTIPSNPGYYGGCITIEPQTADPTPNSRLVE